MNMPKDDRISGLTRIISASIIVVLMLAFAALYIWPDHTDVDFAWTILPGTSAILMGAGYTAGAYFFVRLLGEKKWHRVQAGFLPITAFTVCMLAATLLHLGRFHQGALNFYLWTIIYVLTPLVVPFLWWQNGGNGSTELEENDVRFSRFMRWGLGIFAVLGVAAYLVVFVRPSILISLAPWKLTELTARIFSGWSILVFSTVLSVAWDGRWSATRILLESGAIGAVLTLLGMPRIWNDLDHTRIMTYFFVTGLILALIALIVIHIWLDRSARAGRISKASG
jgi:hypothetical protein